MRMELITQIVIAVATIVNVLVFCFAVRLSHKSNRIAKRMLDLSMSINNETSLQRNKTNRLFWALVFSSVLTTESRSHRKDRIGFIMKIFGWQNVLKESQISPEELNRAANASCDKYFEDAMMEAMKEIPDK